MFRIKGAFCVLLALSTLQTASAQLVIPTPDNDDPSRDLVIPPNASPGAPIGTVYNSKEAVRLAWHDVPRDVKEFPLFLLDSGYTRDEDLQMLVQALPTAPADKYLAITGPHPDRNIDTLAHALAAIKGTDLSGLTLIYLGPSRDASRVADMLRPYKAQLRFIVYPRETKI